MKLPEDFEDRASMTPTVVAAMMAVTVFVAVILGVVLMMNNKIGGKTQQAGNTHTGQDTPTSVITDADRELLAGGSKLRPEDLDFWDMYPEPTAVPEPVATEVPRAEESDPSSDGKHTLVKYADGSEEWVLLNPYLQEHTYDFTKLVRQSNLMKYYENGKKVSYVGVDVSKQQDYIDFVKVKKAGIDFCMIRVGARGYGSGQIVVDDYFAENIKRATDAGLEVGVYFYSQAITEAEAIEEANTVIGKLGGRRLAYPVAFDMELVTNDAARTDGLTVEQRTAITKAFLDIVAMAGYKTAIYGDKEWLINEIDLSQLTEYDVWLSQQEDILLRDGNYSANADVAFSYNGQSIYIPLSSSAVWGRTCQLSWNSRMESFAVNASNSSVPPPK